MTIIAAAYSNPSRYALAADSHGIVNGLRRPSIKAAALSHGWLIGHTGLAAEGHAFVRSLLATGMEDPDTSIRTAYASVLAMTHLRSHDCVGLDTHFLMVGPDGVCTVGSDGHFAKAPSRWAIGCGSDVALGVMVAGDDPATIVQRAVDVCCGLVDGCFGSAIVLTDDYRASPSTSTTTSHGEATNPTHAEAGVTSR